LGTTSKSSIGAFKGPGGDTTVVPLGEGQEKPNLGVGAYLLTFPKRDGAGPDVKGPQ